LSFQTTCSPFPLVVFKELKLAMQKKNTKEEKRKSRKNQKLKNAPLD
jgi:hypothetical protein